jgi:hypothetical protein
MIAVAVAACVGIATSAHAKDRLECELTYNLKGWSAFYRTGKGDGRITCADGTKVDVRIEAHGGGFTFGTFEVIDGEGEFSKVSDLDDLYGTYVEASGHAGAGASVEGRAMFKGDAALTLSGGGTGINLGFFFGGFTIEPK